jgi:Domain of unknown function DUF29
MDGASLYDDDILAWSEAQAAALRSLKGRRELPNPLDLANVVEEVEDVGRSEFRAVEILIENILVHLPGSDARRHRSMSNTNRFDGDVTA